MWVFDDPVKDLDKEPLVAGADTLMDIVSNGSDSSVIVFSDKPFPDYQFQLNWVRPGNEEEPESREYGDWYIAPQFENHNLWLCPALLKYFESAPDRIFVKPRA